MKRAEINQLVSKLLAEKGYSASDYCWRRHVITICGSDGYKRALNLPSGTSKKRVCDQVSLVPACGPEKPWFAPDPISRSMQIDLETAIMNNGADSGTAHALTALRVQ